MLMPPTAEPGTLVLARHARAAAHSSAAHPRAALHLLDWLGCAAIGAHTPQGEALGRWLGLQAPGPAPTLAGTRADRGAAAAYHGALGSALEMDDVHRSSILHPGPVIVPAALAACTATTTGADLLSALLAGYETTIRVGRALGPSHYRLWHSTATAGCFGAAAAAAWLLRLSETETAHALALAGTRSGGLWQVRHEGSLGKAWHMAGAAREGLAAAQLAQAGLTGPLAVLEGPSGWFAATAPQADPGRLDEARPEPWLLDVSVKPWPACRHAHPALDAAMQAADGLPRDRHAVERIVVHTYADALRFCDRERPTTPAESRFSIQHALAVWWLRGEPALSHYEPEALGDPAVAALRPRIRVHLDADIDRRFPEHYGARVEIVLQDGRRLTAALQDTRGDPARPLSTADLQAKARQLMTAAGWPAARVDAALAVCATLPGATSLAALDDVLLGAGPHGATP